MIEDERELRRACANIAAREFLLRVGLISRFSTPRNRLVGEGKRERRASIVRKMEDSINETGEDPSIYKESREEGLKFGLYPTTHGEPEGRLQVGMRLRRMRSDVHTRLRVMYD